jgi:probable rRNA maturation factor
MSRALCTVSLQKAAKHRDLPKLADFRLWVQAALQGAGRQKACEVSIRLVEAEESQALNLQYRGKDKPTNVLSFPSDLPEAVLDGLPREPLGDIIICVPVVYAEAEEAGKTSQAHWTHLTVHGILHLLGFDHIEDDEAEEMEGLEIRILEGMGIANPYEEKA